MRVRKFFSLGNIHTKQSVKKKRSLDCALFCCKALKKRLEHERSRRETRDVGRVFLAEFSSRFVSALQQTEQKGFFFLCFMIKKPLNSSRITF